MSAFDIAPAPQEARRGCIEGLEQSVIMTSLGLLG